MAETYSFALHGVGASVRCENPNLRPALEGLKQDFENFPSSSELFHTEIRVTISEEESASPRGFGKTRLTPSYRWFPRVCFHGSGTTSNIRRRGSVVEAQIRGSDADHVREIAFVAIMSLLGWELEKRGFVRLHALAVVDGEDKVRLFHLAPRGGKSTLALECLREGVEILGDEVVLLRGLSAFSFPIRLAVAPSTAARFSIATRDFQRKTFDRKSLITLPRPRSSPVEIDAVIFQSRAGLSSRLVRASPTWIVRWIVWTVMGFGLPQMREFIVRAEELPAFVGVAWRRLSFAFRYLRSRPLFIGLAIETGEQRELKPRIEWARSNPR